MKVNSFLVAVTDIHLRVMTKSAAGATISDVISDTSEGAAVNKPLYIHTYSTRKFSVLMENFMKYCKH